MYEPDVQRMVDTAVKKTEFLERWPLRYFILAAFAGAYLGFGITLIFSVALPALAQDKKPVAPATIAEMRTRTSR